MSSRGTALEGWLLVDPDQSVSRPTLAQDIGALVDAFAALQQTSFAAFLQHCWDPREFLLIHVACLHRDYHTRFLHEIYAHFLKYILYGDSLFLQLAGFYGLYAVFSTQLGEAGREQQQIVSIPLTPESWAGVKELQRQASLRSIHDVSYLLCELQQQHAIQFTAFDACQYELFYYMRHVDPTGKFPLVVSERRQRTRQILQQELDSVEETLASALPAEYRSRPLQVNCSLAAETSPLECQQQQQQRHQQGLALDQHLLEEYCREKAKLLQVDGEASMREHDLQLVRDPQDWMQRIVRLTADVEHALLSSNNVRGSASEP